MTSASFHFIDARGALTHHRDWLQASLLETWEKVIALMPLRPLDVIVRTGTHVIPQKGHLGYAPEPGVIFLTVDPANAAFSANHEASFERMFAHELHHAARWDGPGYGTSLGEALVSEGLAGAFVLEVFGGPPEPWECIEVASLRGHAARALCDWERTDYGHNAWFFGASDLPVWLGYSLGFQLVSRFLAEHQGSRASRLVEVDAQVFRGTLEAIEQEWNNDAEQRH